MVGVIGGSKACAECKRRKVKCDEALPECWRCTRIGLRCSGPIVGPLFRRQKIGDAGVVVIDQQPKNSLSPVAAARTVHGRLDTRESNTSSTDETAVQASRSGSWSGTRSNADELAQVAPMGPIAVYPTDEKHLMNFCATYFVGTYTDINSFNKIRAADNVSFVWADKVSAYVEGDSSFVTTLAGRALSMLYSSQCLKSEKMKYDGVKWYLEALRKQRSAMELISAYQKSGQWEFLKHPVVRDSLVAASMLTAIEILIPSSKFAWVNLMYGSLDLFRMLGPQMCELESAFELFEGLRLTSAIACMVFHKTSFLSSPEWMFVPYNTRFKSRFQCLLDIVLQLSSLLALLAQYVSSDYLNNPAMTRLWDEAFISRSFLRSDIRMIERIRKRLVVLDIELDNFFEDYIQDRRDEYNRTFAANSDAYKFDSKSGVGFSIITEMCPSVSSEHEWTTTHFFKPPLEYSSIEDCKIVSMYYATRTKLMLALLATLPFSLMHKSSKLFVDCIKSTEYSESLRAYETKSHEYISMICRSSTFVLKRWSSHIMILYLYPLRVAYTSAANEAERVYIRNILRLFQRRGVGLSMTGSDLDGPRTSPEVTLSKCKFCMEALRSQGTE
ncbi:hypothetical protein V1511DRAFT_324206 [Dipodascopsis uninucleata]